ncbi:MAG: hypothetical protein JJ885_12015 [Muricauda sp.]|nr:hypothetical protein [Allomuricauda sp.]MBO6532830.1 hypothetical protein [Allomuricauda sp.]MBO6644975.1 hypothetical protein [Allomuricauda sp.]MBO6747250.1 hypothetical protein [Allomuricauda sp.]MBO6845066.1 hypothetical protein [Allomuricauda sp.]
MKTYIVYLVIGLVAINSLSAQVKIGDNPQNLNPASLLELQSSNRVLVITRVTDAQMSGISPLPGAVVYNTDQGCLHYYNGTEWINICEELDNSFTVSTRADSLQQVNPNARDNTIAILESINPDGSTNYNFEVNRITGANIVDTSINGSTKLQNESVTNNKLAEKSVGLRNLADATNTGDLLMYNGTAWNFVNRTDLLNTQLDSIVGNEVVGPTDATLLVNGAGSQADPLTLDVAEGGITAFEIATGAVTTDEILNGNILTEDISDDAVTTSKIFDGAVTNAKLDKANIPLSGFAAAAANVDLGDNRIVRLADPVDALDAVNLQYLEGSVSTLETLTTIVQDAAAGTVTYTDEDGADTVLDLNALIDNAETLTSLALNADGVNLDFTDEDGNTNQINLATLVAAQETLTTIVQDAAAGTVTYTDEDGADTVLNTTTQPIDFTNTDRTLTNTNYTLILQSGGTFTSGVTLPDPAMTPFGKIFVIRNNSGGQVNIVNPIPTSPFPPLNNNEAIWVQTDGNDWYQIN